MLLIICIIGCQQTLFTNGFVPQRFGDYNPHLTQPKLVKLRRRSLARATPSKDDETDVGAEDVQWELFQQHHVGSWKGLWTTYDAMGDKLLESAAVVENALSEDQNAVHVTQSIIQESVSADCPTCFDSSTAKELPVANYDSTLPDWTSKYRLRFGANGMVVGPKVLRSGVSKWSA